MIIQQYNIVSLLNTSPAVELVLQIIAWQLYNYYHVIRLIVSKDSLPLCLLQVSGDKNALGWVTSGINYLSIPFTVLRMKA